MEDSGGLPSDVEELQTVIEEEESRLATLREKMAQESSKRERYKVRGERGGRGKIEHTEWYGLLFGVSRSRKQKGEQRLM